MTFAGNGASGSPCTASQASSIIDVMAGSLSRSPRIGSMA